MNPRIALKWFTVGEGVFMIYSGSVALFHAVTGHAPHALFPLFGLRVPFIVAIPPMLLLIGIFLLIFPLSSRIQLSLSSRKAIPVRVLIAAYGLNFMYIGILGDLSHHIFDIWVGAGIVGLPFAGGLAFHIIFQHIIGGGILTPLYNIKPKILTPVKKIASK